MYGLPERFFREAKYADLKLGKVSYNDDDAAVKLLQINDDVTGLVQQFKRSIETVSRQVKQYDNAAKKIYKLIDVELQFYRFTEIQTHFEDIENNRSRDGPSSFKIQQFKSGIESMLQTLYGSIERANKEFNPDADVDDNIYYLSTLARQFETSIKYFAKYDKEKENEAEWQLLDGFDDEEDDNQAEDESDINTAIEDLEESESEWAEKAEQEMEKMLDEVG